MEQHQTLRNVCLIGLAGLLTVHFLMTLAVTLPPTPLTTEYGKAIDSWIHPYFTQAWSFFAPTPPIEDDFVIAQYRYTSSSGSTVESPWINLSRTLNEATQRDRLSSLAIVQQTVSNAYGDLARSPLFKDGKLDEKLLERLTAAHRQPPSLHTLERAAMSCYRITSFKGEPVAVRIGILNHKYPRFTHRYEKDNPEAENSEIQFLFVPFESVAAFD
jgi:Family of unknown function (DUF5819)